LKDTSRDFWSEIKRLRGSKCKLSGTIDGLTDATDIAQLFASGYKELCTSVPYNKGDMQDVIDDLNVTLGKSPISRDCIFNIHEIRDAISRLKARKNDGCSSLTSEHFLFADESLLVHIGFLFTSIVVHGNMPDSFLQ
jgi:hypothetical protein